ncbi:NMT1/THI5 like protein [Blastochloris viridis]|uniref:ABC-type taurine transport system, periplasmic component n=2 Tax=Blastochloris viridis TaxID=1079 RepID=A0A0P0JKS1_BLAVI|nr:NMT1/THI5 like protein [Blastochloris viridis]CUU42505.1 ABC-type taurine transport system, periplasmic component [Blastochloris viridis]
MAHPLQTATDRKTAPDGASSEVPQPTRLSRRALLQTAGATASLSLLAGSALAQPAASAPAAPAVIQPSTKITIIWNPSSLCLVVVGLAQQRGIFEKHGLEVDTLNVGSDTNAILEAVALGKADATSNNILRFIKPLEAGFDVKLTAGVHAGCSYLIASRAAGITSIADLRGKRIGMADLASPNKFLYASVLKKAGIDPDNDITWRQFPADVFSLAVDKGEIDAFVDNHPNAYFVVKRSQGKLFELASNGTGELGMRTCCVLAIRGSLIRENRPAAAGLTRAFVEAALLVDGDNSLAVTAARHFAPHKASDEEIGEMIASYPYDAQRGCPTGEEFRQQVLSYARDLKEVGVLKPGTDPVRFTNRVFVDLLKA